MTDDERDMIGVHPELRDALVEAFDMCFMQSLYDDNEPVYWVIHYSDTTGWFTTITANQKRWARA